MEEEKINPGHSKPRSFLRIAGPVLLITGSIVSIIGIILFFLSFFGIWASAVIGLLLLFLGSPLLFVGLVLTLIGNMGKIARFQAAEIAPVGKDTFNYLADSTQESVETISRAIGSGLGTGLSKSSAGEQNTKIRCHKCNELLDEDAKFCDNCGIVIAKTISCSGCDELNDPDAKFCDNCGSKLQ